MSAKRTEAERARIIDRCLDIEAEGGDVIGYLRGEHYVSPRATWTNMQKNELHRNITRDGRPTGVKCQRQKTPPAILDAIAREGQLPEPVAENARMKSRRVRAAVLEMLKEGKYAEAREFLRKEGIRQIDQMIYQVRKDAGLPGPKRGPKTGTRKQSRPPMGDMVKEAVAPVTPQEAENEEKKEPETVDKPVRFVRIREIENGLDKEFIRLVEKAHVAPIGAGMELIQEELYVVLMRLHALREVRNMGRNALLKEVG